MLVCSILGLDLLVCQVEGHGDLAEKWEMAILRCESVPGKVTLGFFTESAEYFHLARAYTPRTKSHSPKALHKTKEFMIFFQESYFNVPSMTPYAQG